MNLTPKPITVLAALFILSALLGQAAEGALSLPHFFSDHMVLQRETPAAIWGTAAPNTKVTVAFKNKKASVESDADGRFSLRGVRPDGGLGACARRAPFERWVVARSQGEELRLVAPPTRKRTAPVQNAAAEPLPAAGFAPKPVGSRGRHAGGARGRPRCRCYRGRRPG